MKEFNLKTMIIVRDVSVRVIYNINCNINELQ